MATKSFLKNVSIDNSKSAQGFIDALNSSRKVPHKKRTEFSRTCKEITGDKIKEFFGL